MTATPLRRTEPEAERSRPFLLAEIQRVVGFLEAYGAGEPDIEAGVLESRTTPTPLDRLCSRLELSAFERDVLVLAAAVELDGDVAALVSGLQGGGDPRPTFALALAALPGAHWDALVPERPLRRWGLVELCPGTTVATRPLAIDEQVLHTITGLAQENGTLGGLIQRVDRATPLTESQSQIADGLVASVDALHGRILVRLEGDDSDAETGVAARLAEGLGLTAFAVREEALSGPELGRAAMLIDREVLVADRLPVLAGDQLVPLLGSRVVVVTGDGEPVRGRTVVARTVDLPGATEQIRLWEDALASAAALPDKVVDAIPELAHHYRLTARTIAAVAGEWTALPVDERSGEDLRRLTRERARVSMGALAELIEDKAEWDDLVLPEGQMSLLKDLASQVRYRSQVYEDWGFADKANRGLGVTALFAGESGTGKTMAAEVIAADLGLDLYRIDLSAVVSKYIGETEKNLRRLFDAAESGGAVLLFDEADALFGKRSDVKDSHDRYANLEVAYLLQRMESYRGLAILTTNLSNNVDRAFLRRLRFLVQFPFPDEGLRSEIWRRAFPSRTPTEDLNPSALARMQVSGGSIRSIAVAAAFAAADAGTPVRPEHVLHAAKVEYAKAQRSLTDTEIALIGRTGGGR